jgi:hypothetical protein
VRRSRRIGPARAVAETVLVAALVAACAGAAMEPTYPAVPGVQEVDLTWQPREGMRIVHRVTTDVTASGELTKPIADTDKKQHISVTRTVEVTGTGPDYFDVRLGQNDATLPATLRFSRDWTPREVRPDKADALGEKDRAVLDNTLRQAADPLVQSAQFFGHWKVGQTRSFDIRLSSVPGTSGQGQGTMTFRGVVVIDGRQAAEFAWQARTEFVFEGDPGKGTPGWMSISGREWRDLATGASLRLTAKATAEFTRQGEPTRVEYQTVETLDLAASRL